MLSLALLGVPAPAPAPLLALLVCLGATFISGAKTMSQFNFSKRGLENYSTDQSLESSRGVWIDYGDRAFQVLRAGGSNHRYVRALAAALRPHARAISKRTMDPAKLRQIYWDLFARHVVIGWRGIQDTEGNDIPFSEEAALAFFESFPDLFDEIKDYAEDMGTFAEEGIEEAAETLGNSSSTRRASGAMKKP